MHTRHPHITGPQVIAASRAQLIPFIFGVSNVAVTGINWMVYGRSGLGVRLMMKKSQVERLCTQHNLIPNF